jgi:triosephosphate isomerase
MVKEFCQYVILGHSERRAIFNESDGDIQRKMEAALAADLRPVLCVGETLEQNEAGRAAEVVSGQLRAALDGARVNSADALVIAYEPGWAIGTGKAATPEATNTVLRNVVRPTLAGLFGEPVGQGVRLLYGGSVNAANAAAFFSESEIDGALVGGASLKAQDFVSIVKAVKQKV